MVYTAVQSEGRRKPPKSLAPRHGWRSSTFSKDTKKKFALKVTLLKVNLSLFKCLFYW